MHPIIYKTAVKYLYCRGPQIYSFSRRLIYDPVDTITLHNGVKEVAPFPFKNQFLKNHRFCLAFFPSPNDYIIYFKVNWWRSCSSHMSTTILAIIIFSSSQPRPLSECIQLFFMLKTANDRPTNTIYWSIKAAHPSKTLNCTNAYRLI